ncbi:LysE family translocator [Marinimicrobium sp. ARAG 43.8]|uniref:LysE family translocator n=1 Tax=Marinimicrobium sp. ARAG 43.8 TaxID=3418719 RepID=UPI003CF73E60
MSTEQLLSLAGFVVVMVGTPGPNNLMLMASGVNFGLRRSVPHLVGIAFGCQALLLAAAFGLGQVLALYPSAVIILRVLSAAFLGYMAWLLLSTRTAPESDTNASHPMRFWQATLFQWVNPKAWLICLALVATHTDPHHLAVTTAWASLVFLLIGVPIMVAWTAGGMVMKTWLQTGERLLWFNRLMALLLVASLYPIIA